jgi:tellurite resistance protein TerC
MDYSIIAIVIQLIFLECVLSIDNAAVLGAMVSTLSDTEPIPWPKALAALGHSMNKLMGNQRTGALRVGLLMAYVLRGAMLFAASFIIHNPWLKIIGAIYLIRLALEDLSASGIEGGEEGEKNIAQRGFWMTVLVVNLMDMAFSIDNVVAAVSLSSKIWVVMVGVAIGILVMRFAAGIFSYIVEREPILKTAAYILVFNIGVELLIEEFLHIEIGDWLRFGISIATILLTLAYAHFRFLRFFRPALIWISQGFALVNGTITWVLAPVKGIFNLLIRLFGLIFKRREPAEISG